MDKARHACSKICAAARAKNSDNQRRHIHAMSVIPLTLFFSLLLAGTFVLLFAREQRRRRFGSAERDSLLPLADETPREVTSDQVELVQPVRHSLGDGGRPRSTHEEEHDHDHGDGPCGCRQGARPPCAGCLKRRDEQEPAYF
jgi:hypothetical protein